MLLAFRILAGCVLAVPVALACVAYDPSATPARYVGDVGGLERVRSRLWDEVHREPGLDLAVYRAVQIVPVVLAEPLDTQRQHYRVADLERVRHKFDLALKHEFAGSPLLRDEAGSGVLELRVTLTGVRANRPPLDATPSGSLTTERGVGGATMQLDLRDSETDALLMAIVDRKWGVEFTDNFNRSQTWGDAEEAFRWWARKLREMFERELAPDPGAVR